MVLALSFLERPDVLGLPLVYLPLMFLFAFGVIGRSDRTRVASRAPSGTEV